MSIIYGRIRPWGDRSATYGKVGQFAKRRRSIPGRRPDLPSSGGQVSGVDSGCMQALGTPLRSD